MNSAWSIGAGVLLGLSYIVANIIVVKIAENRSKFVPIVLGGMLLRMLVALILLIIVIQFFPVVPQAFSGVFLLMVFLGIFSEILWLTRRNC
ncbi:MAG: hypothetical protein OXE59_05415 [Bacteroidetes bacterium]|nr:hypothetical protein [Bacteroidota bacterium]MCY4233164.1 hypothetical protein [Bacteroidota bacterium]